MTRRQSGVMWSAMGRDGADAMRLMHDAGSWNIARDEASCVVYGMPREAVAAGAVSVILPLSRIAGAVPDHLRPTEGFPTRV